MVHRRIVSHSAETQRTGQSHRKISQKCPIKLIILPGVCSQPFRKHRPITNVGARKMDDVVQMIKYIGNTQLDVLDAVRIHNGIGQQGDR